MAGGMDKKARMKPILIWAIQLKLLMIFLTCSYVVGCIAIAHCILRVSKRHERIIGEATTFILAVIELVSEHMVLSLIPLTVTFATIALFRIRRSKGTIPLGLGGTLVCVAFCGLVIVAANFCLAMAIQSFLHELEFTSLEIIDILMLSWISWRVGLLVSGALILASLKGRFLPQWSLVDVSGWLIGLFWIIAMILQLVYYKYVMLVV